MPYKNRPPITHYRCAVTNPSPTRSTPRRKKKPTPIEHTVSKHSLRQNPSPLNKNQEGLLKQIHEWAGAMCEGDNFWLALERFSRQQAIYKQIAGLLSTLHQTGLHRDQQVLIVGLGLSSTNRDHQQQTLTYLASLNRKAFGLLIDSDTLHGKRFLAILANMQQDCANIICLLLELAAVLDLNSQPAYYRKPLVNGKSAQSLTKTFNLHGGKKNLYDLVDTANIVYKAIGVLLKHVAPQYWSDQHIVAILGLLTLHDFGSHSEYALQYQTKIKYAKKIADQLGAQQRARLTTGGRGANNRRLSGVLDKISALFLPDIRACLQSL